MYTIISQNFKLILTYYKIVNPKLFLINPPLAILRNYIISYFKLFHFKLFKNITFKLFCVVFNYVKLIHYLLLKIILP